MSDDRRTGPDRRDEIVERVRADLLRRSQLGIAKYGTTIAENPAQMRERLQHAYEEALDLANYLQWCMMQIDGNASTARSNPSHPVGCGCGDCSTRHAFA